MGVKSGRIGSLAHWRSPQIPPRPPLLLPFFGLPATSEPPRGAPGRGYSAAEATHLAVVPPISMRPSLKDLRSRASERARSAAEGASPPVGQEPLPADQAKAPGAVERGTMRRRLRRARRMRETLMTELGALVMEMHRQGRHNPALVERKAREALVADREAAGLARALGSGQGVREVVAAGIAGGCRVCGALLATDDRYCARCGAATDPARNGAAAGGQPVAAYAPPPAQVAAVAAPPPDPASWAPAPAPVPPAGGPPPPPPPDPNTRVLPPGGGANTVQTVTER
jgi:hypothetical protein